MSKRSKTSSVNDDLDIPETPPEFFKAGVMGKYYNEYVGRHGKKPVTAVVLEEDVARVFRDSKTVNDMLRAIIRSMPQAETRKRRKTA